MLREHACPLLPGAREHHTKLVHRYNHSLPRPSTPIYRPISTRTTADSSFPNSKSREPTMGINLMPTTSIGLCQWSLRHSKSSCIYTLTFWRRLNDPRRLEGDRSRSPTTVFHYSPYSFPFMASSVEGHIISISVSSCSVAFPAVRDVMASCCRPASPAELAIVVSLDIRQRLPANHDPRIAYL